MKHFLTIFLLSFLLNTLSAQEKHFVFIQSDNNQPFNVSLNGKLYSSSASGYLIIPKLTDGTYKFSVGFAKDAYPEQSFECVIDKKDLGFNLKNFGEKGWGLFNLQSLAVTMAGVGNSGDVAKAVSEKAETQANNEQVISFDKKPKDTAALAQTKPAIDTAAVAAAKPEEPKTAALQNDTVAAVKQERPADTLLTASPPIKNTESVADTNAAAANQAIKSVAADTSANSSSLLKSNTGEGDTNNVTKISETKEAEGLRLAYLDGKNKDTIQVIIPSVPSPASDVSKVSADASPSLITPPAVMIDSSVIKKTNKDDLRFLDVDMKGAKKDTVQTAMVNAQNTAVTPPVNCMNVAEQEDFVKLRKKMAMETSDEKMIAVAKKVYRNKCFTTMQIKSLSSLFISDEGRFKFFAASYASAADAGQYSTLQSQFIDPSFVTRFKAMLQ